MLKQANKKTMMWVSLAMGSMFSPEKCVNGKAGSYRASSYTTARRGIWKWRIGWGSGIQVVADTNLFLKTVFTCVGFCILLVRPGSSRIDTNVHTSGFVHACVF
jgi:hypothetical protein